MLTRTPSCQSTSSLLDSVIDYFRLRYRSIEGSLGAVQVRAGLASLYNGIANPALFDSVECFCLFIGHGRSGSTLVGALLNAHKNVVLANELNALHYVRAGMSRKALFNYIRMTAKNQARHGSTGGGGYTYSVAEQWQGKHERIKVIGDRKAGATAIQLFREPELLGALTKSVRIPIKFVCVVRNPFDAITTTIKKTHRRPDEAVERHLQRQIQAYFQRWSAVEAVLTELGHEHVALVRHEAFVGDTQRQLSILCRFLGLKPDEDYLAACASIVEGEPRVTRRTVHWPPELIEEVHVGIASTPWLGGYSFESAP